MARAIPLFTTNSAGDVLENFPLMLHVRLAEMLRFSYHIHDPANVTELHNMRIAAKRLRYTLELFLPYCPINYKRSATVLLDKTKKIQEYIGDIHDCDVRIPMITEYIRRNETDYPEIRLGLAKIIKNENALRNTKYTELVDFWMREKDEYVYRLMHLIATIGQPESLVQDLASSNTYPAPKIKKAKSLIQSEVSDENSRA